MRQQQVVAIGTTAAVPARCLLMQFRSRDGRRRWRTSHAQHRCVPCRLLAVVPRWQRGFPPLEKERSAGVAVTTNPATTTLSSCCYRYPLPLSLAPPPPPPTPTPSGSKDQAEAFCRYQQQGDRLPRSACAAVSLSQQLTVTVAVPFRRKRLDSVTDALQGMTRKETRSSVFHGEGFLR